jgi:hypothetical protein
MQTPRRPGPADPPPFVQKPPALWKVVHLIRRIDLHRSRVMGMRATGKTATDGDGVRAAPSRRSRGTLHPQYSYEAPIIRCCGLACA